MNIIKDFVDIHGNRKYIIFGLATSFILYIVSISNVNNSKIITLSSTSKTSQEVNLPNNSSTTQVSGSEPDSVIQMRSDSSVNILTEAAVKLGILSCVSRINQIATFLTTNNQAGIFIFKPQNQPDKHIFSTSFELVRNDNSTFYASASFFPNQDAVYDTVEYVEKNCEELEKTVFANLKRISVLKKNIIVLNGGTVKVFLMPAGSGTVVIKKEVIR